ncbi:MAG: DNA cytosine methyltransferase [Gammaproteobacteria bacterium]|nr:DNA cytosine methyltransferase [Gammaproteobacteria bacterium]
MEKNNASSRRWLTAVDLFAGSGSVTAALKSSHYRVLAAVDEDANACATYRLNHPGTKLFQQDIRTVGVADIRRAIASSLPLDLIVICAPCQPFSNQNRYRKNDDRFSLLLEGARLVKGLKPKTVFIENVPGLANSDKGNLLAKFMAICGQDYAFTEPLMVDAADYGVPQRRRRCLIMAAKGKSPPEIPKPNTPKDRRVTVRAAIQSLPSLRSGETDAADLLHAARKHRPIALKRLEAIPKDGGSRCDLPNELTLTCHKGQTGYPDVYGRMAWDDVAPTLTTGCTDITRGRFAHPEDDRAITNREASLLQTFPRSYKFSGMPKTISTQIGNAVPYELFRAFIPSLRQAAKQCF